MGEFIIPVPVEIGWMAEAVGEELTFTFIESMAGQKIWIPRLRVERSSLAQSWGVPMARCLKEQYGGERWEVPMLKAWRIRRLAFMGLSNNEIIARVGISRRYLQRTLYTIKDDMRRGLPMQDERQLSLF